MLLQLENSQPYQLEMLLNFAKEHHLNLKKIDDMNDTYLPGKPLKNEELLNLIEKSRESGMMTLETAHNSIRKSFNAD
jgi:hypothetical protein